MTDPEGWQRPTWEAGSGPERLEERQRSLGAWNERAQALVADAADMSLGACVSSDSERSEAKCEGNLSEVGCPVKETAGNTHRNDDRSPSMPGERQQPRRERVNLGSECAI